MGLFNKKPNLEEQFEWNTSSTYDSFWRSAKEFVLEIAKVVVISLAIIIPIRYFLIQPFYVKGASMEPNFVDHQYLIIDELSYRLSDPKRGEIIVFRYPKDPRQYFIKRIMGLPGETVRVRDGKVYIINADYPQGVLVNENDYLSDSFTAGNKEVQLGEDEYFVLGDNRSASLDSRGFGTVPRRLIIGRVWLRGWPFDQIRAFSAPDYKL